MRASRSGIRTCASQLWAVDWDGAALAPRERDLALFAGQGFARFLDDYDTLLVAATSIRI